jgi:hypothetical protein
VLVFVLLVLRGRLKRQRGAEEGGQRNADA